VVLSVIAIASVESLGAAGADFSIGGRPLLFLGDISYALYLWHWPLIVFMGLSLQGPLSSSAKISLAGLSVLIASVSTYWVENRFRHFPKTGKH